MSFIEADVLYDVKDIGWASGIPVGIVKLTYVQLNLGIAWTHLFASQLQDEYQDTRDPAALVGNQSIAKGSDNLLPQNLFRLLGHELKEIWSLKRVSGMTLHWNWRAQFKRKIYWSFSEIWTSHRRRRDTRQQRRDFKEGYCEHNEMNVWITRKFWRK